MSFLSDLFEGNFGNLGHDLTAHFGQDLPWYLGAGLAGLGGAGLAGMGPFSGLSGLFGGAGASEATNVGLPELAGAAGGGGGGGGGFLGGIGDFFKNYGGLLGAGVAGAGLLGNLFGGGGGGGGGGVTGSPSASALAAQAGQYGPALQSILQQIYGNTLATQNQAATLGTQASSELDPLAKSLGTNVDDLAAKLGTNYADLQRRISEQMTGVSTETAQLSAEQKARIDPIAQNLMSQYRTLIDPLSSGTLPTDAESKLQLQNRDAKNAVKAKYAQFGMTGSSAETEDLNNADMKTNAQRFDIAQQMASTATQVSAQALNALQSETSTDVQLLQNKYGDLGNLLAQSGALTNQESADLISLLGKKADISMSLKGKKYDMLSDLLGISSKAGTEATSQSVGAITSIGGLQQSAYQSLMQQEIAQNKDLQNAIAAFAAALGRMSGYGGASQTFKH